MTLHALCASLAEIREKIEQERIARDRLRSSEEWVELQKQIDLLLEKQGKLILSLEDSSIEYEAKKREIIEKMKEENVYAVGNVSAKFREKKEVNRSKALEALGGDLDMYFTISTITQVALKDFAKENPAFKKGLMDAIEVVSKEIVDVEIDTSLPSAQ